MKNITKGIFRPYIFLLLLSGMVVSVSLVSGRELPNHSEKVMTTNRRLLQRDEYFNKAYIQQIFFSDRSFDQNFGFLFDYSQYFFVNEIPFLFNTRVPITKEKWEDFLIEGELFKGGDIVFASTRLSLAWIAHQSKGDFFSLSAEGFLPIKHSQFALGIRADGTLALCKTHPNSVDVFFSLAIDKPLSKGKKDLVPFDKFTEGLQMDGIVGVGINIHKVVLDVGYHFNGEWHTNAQDLVKETSLADALKRYLTSRHDIFVGLGAALPLKENTLFIGAGASSAAKENINLKSSDVNYWGKVGFAF